MSDLRPTTDDPWRQLRATTTARIALGRAGGSLPTAEWLAFKAAHAAARDAVHDGFDAARIAGEIAELGVETAVVSSAARDRTQYLQRPDLGRQLDESSEGRIAELAAKLDQPDLAILVADGLSAAAIHRQCVPLLTELLPKLRSDQWRLAPIVVARFGRVALQDAVGETLGARLALSLVGERPGLGTPDSLGVYLVYGPKRGNTDAQRNCISNIHAAGLQAVQATETIHHLLTKARALALSGVALKDDRPLPSPPTPELRS